MRKIGWGILGCGKIANKFAADLKLVEDAALVAVAARDAGRAQAFADLHGALQAFDDYDKLVNCEEVDVIYVATPHGFHHEHALLCIHHGKAVLCEKALALNARQVSEMISAARGRNVFLMEAFWTKFLPQYQKMTALIQTGEVGEIRHIQADFGFKAPDPLPARLYDPVLGGGSLLDIGIYPVFLATTLLGRPSRISALMEPYNTGVDRQISVSMRFESGALATLSSTFDVETPVDAVISGTAGTIALRNRFHNATARLEFSKGKDKPAPVEVSREEGYGYQYEARHVTECLQNNLTESPIMTFNDSQLLIETLDRIREVCGIRYSADKL